ncbi:hypothetical protein G7K71_18955 [Desulfofundulus sp. TPOSR]|uniref:hypothetical protein n=1 Tax=Desulfofundulus sp. TPOSR TaxID=2714340 RepID=UPI0014088BE3|nr:hypothetical protein [Desulfofundulus sp. TPOSR]NHM29002.1 hypothetical protein [Desulfofundulus sp. TPOSR]
MLRVPGYGIESMGCYGFLRRSGEYGLPLQPGPEAVQPGGRRAQGPYIEEIEATKGQR